MAKEEKILLWLVAFVGLVMIVSRKSWTLPIAGESYRQHFEQAELENGLPKNILARMAQQESAFRQDIISGETKSHAGAIGLMQIIPRWHPDVDPYDPVASIYYAGRYMKQNYDRFGDWRLALAAYNYGPGNVSRVKGDVSKMPKETRDYVKEISHDIGLA